MIAVWIVAALLVFNFVIVPLLGWSVRRRNTRRGPR